MDEKLKQVKFFVEATSAEQHFLWADFKRNRDIKDWEQDPHGFGSLVGSISKGKNVFVSFNFAKIYGVEICFYNATSRFVDHTMVECYIDEHYPLKYDNDSRIARCDAQNFHQCIHFCEANKVLA